MITIIKKSGFIEDCGTILSGPNTEQLSSVVYRLVVETVQMLLH
jgi:hypothetical protein